jgi:hypothetical protein
VSQNTANVIAMDETTMYDYSSVRICLNANIPTFLFINRWCKAKKPSLMRGRGIPVDVKYVGEDERTDG